MSPLDLAPAQSPRKRTCVSREETTETWLMTTPQRGGHLAAAGPRRARTVCRSAGRPSEGSWEAPDDPSRFGIAARSIA
jgi:hypothetical protein